MLRFYISIYSHGIQTCNYSNFDTPTCTSIIPIYVHVHLWVCYVSLVEPPTLLCKVSKSFIYSFPRNDFMVRRMILDLSRLNRSIPCPRFRMTIVKAVRQVLDQWSWIVTLDLKDTYWQGPFQLRMHRNDSGSCLPPMSKQT